MTDTLYEGAAITIVNRSGRCIHSRHCVLDHPEVFVPNAEGPWIRPDAASPEEVIAIVERCPSGALGYVRHDGASERAPGVNTVRLTQDGPLAFRGELSVAGDKSSRRATLCRCGQSKNKPYCDNSHRDAAFSATAEPATQASEPLAARAGPLEITPTANGPLMVKGSLEICAGLGRTLNRVSATFLCRCGASQTKPYCDGSHKTHRLRGAGLRDGVRGGLSLLPASGEKVRMRRGVVSGNGENNRPAPHSSPLPVNGERGRGYGFGHSPLALTLAPSALAWQALE